MKVVILGGYGVFGGNLARLLMRDGHEVVIAGRNPAKGAALAAELRVSAIAVDRNDDLSALWAANPDAVVDAAGPFHAYGDDPYRLPRACIAAGVSYLDLADDAAFCAGISALDDAARAAGVFALSGMSSVPAISSAALQAMAGEADEIALISSAILPGNRAARGTSVIASILHQCGTDRQMPRAGETVTYRSWSRPARFDLGQDIRRRGWMIGVPDQALFTKAFGARTVEFRAGMELGLMNQGLAILSWLRGKLRFGMPRWFVRLMEWLAQMLAPFGTDVGGMSVAVVARHGAVRRRDTWRMVVRGGEGPYIPAVPARAVLRDAGKVTPGARPAVAEVPLADVENAMKDLAVTTERLSEDITPLFPGFLGADFAALPAEVQAGHEVYGPFKMAGRVKVSRGSGLWPRLIAFLFRFPPASDDVPVTVTMTPQDGGELWERRFGRSRFQSFLKVQNGQMTERFGPLTFTLGLHVADGKLHYPVQKGQLGPIPLPRFMLPVSEAQEFASDGKFRFDVALRAPLTGGLMVHYQGWLVPSGLGDGEE
ncbi:MAG: DUF4166 domain-containing protein [Pseudomonadota bacterium]